ncbi:uncharacterized protein BYT42DRAFT_569693 [Radiomyces spectabilis]|uniref:uncharacterized protein n=1 Tax=Radiomyces spectabilis TaxID=64574 RepID=UPI002220B73E|nr:uncharacterized protein BYT42DRAFT_569693 [Radiomyces spectabilis]KAI8379701.1 hypothetical protein BYT42DRAFT_569693 [Radiomyces spectabilis]
MTPPICSSPGSSAHDDDSTISKKRTRVTPSQLIILEETFSVTATPDSKMRKRLAEKLDMPERSIQIWFQNRRAKVKMLQRRALLREEQSRVHTNLGPENGPCPANSFWYPTMSFPSNSLSCAKLPLHRAWSTDNIHSASLPYPPLPPPPPPASLFPFSFESLSMTSHVPPLEETHYGTYSNTVSPTSTPRAFSDLDLQRTASDIVPGVPNPAMTVMTHPVQKPNNSCFITAGALTIGTWHRMKINQQDLLCYYSLPDRSFTWHICDSNYHFKMAVSSDAIAAIVLNILDDGISAHIDIHLTAPPIFFMKNQTPTGANWIQCSDYTEGMQATCIMQHSVQGLAVDLRQELLAIVSVDQQLSRITRFPMQTLPGPMTMSIPTPSSSVFDQSLLFSQFIRHQSLPAAGDTQWLQPTMF